MLLRRGQSEWRKRLLPLLARHVEISNYNELQTRSCLDRQSEWRKRLLPLLARHVETSNYNELQTRSCLDRQPQFLSKARDLSVNFSCRDCDESGVVLRKVFHFSSGAANDLVQQTRGIATSAYGAAGEGGEEEEPVRSPLSQAPGPLGSGGRKLGVSATRTAQAVLTGIRQSPQKLNLVAEMVRGMRVDDALTQMVVSVKRAAKTVFKVVHSAQANAVHNFGLEKDRLVISEAFVGKDRYLKRVMPHGKGKAGKLEHPRARLTVIVKEMSAEQEADLARLRVFRLKGTNMSRTQARLAPHRVLETQWNRKRTPVATNAEPVAP